MAQTELRDVVCQKEFNDLLANRDLYSRQITDKVELKAAAWGVSVEHIQLKNIDLVCTQPPPPPSSCGLSLAANTCPAQSSATAAAAALALASPLVPGTLGDGDSEWLSTDVSGTRRKRRSAGNQEES